MLTSNIKQRLGACELTCGSWSSFAHPSGIAGQSINVDGGVVPN
jgi:hypothetical protein